MEAHKELIEAVLAAVEPITHEELRHDAFLMILEHELSSGPARTEEAGSSGETDADVSDHSAWEMPRDVSSLGITTDQLQLIIDFGSDGKPEPEAALIAMVPGKNTASQQRNAILLIALRNAVLGDDLTAPRDEFNALCKEHAIEDTGGNLTGNLKKPKWFTSMEDPSGWKLTSLGRTALKELVTDITAEETP